MNGGRGGLSQDTTTRGNGGNLYPNGGELYGSGSGGTEGVLHLGYNGTSAVGTVKLRQGNTVIERPFTMEQDCPQPLGWEWVIIAAAAFIVFFGYLLVWWFRQK